MFDSYSPPELRWFALYVRVRHERTVERQLAEKGLEAFLPCYVARRQWADRLKMIEFPLFPGYLFCRFTSQQRGAVLSAFGVVRIVGFGNQLMPVDDGEILALQQAVRAGVECEPAAYLKIGQRVRVGYGALNGVEGILTEAKKGHRLILSVTLLERSVSVEVDGAAVEAVSSPPLQAMRAQGAAFRVPA